METRTTTSKYFCGFVHFYSVTKTLLTLVLLSRVEEKPLVSITRRRDTIRVFCVIVQVSLLSIRVTSHQHFPVLPEGSV